MSSMRRSRQDIDSLIVLSVRRNSFIFSFFSNALISQDYGNEKEAGAGIQRAIKDGLVKREDLFVVSKLWCTFHEREKVEPIVRQQLEWWGIE